MRFAFVASGRETDRPVLRALGGLLERKQFRLERFVRVACPARGSTFYQDAPEKAIQPDVLARLDPFSARGSSGAAVRETAARALR